MCREESLDDQWNLSAVKNDRTEDSLCVGFNHDVAVDQDGADDGEGEQGVGENVDCNPKKIVCKFMHILYVMMQLCYLVF